MLSRHGRAARIVLLASLVAELFGCGALPEDQPGPAAAERAPAVHATGAHSFGLGSVAGALTLPTYSGGPLLSPEIVTIYWGTFTQAEQDSNQAYIAGLANHMSGLTAPFGMEPTTMAYGVYGATVGATMRDLVLPSQGGVLGHANATDAKNEIEDLQAHGLLPPYSPQRLFVLMTKGITWDPLPDLGLGTYGSWCAYHASFAANQYYAVAPFPYGGVCGSDGIDGFSANAVFHVAVSHEVFEAATDPRNNGWAPEIGDGCEGGSGDWEVLPFGTVQKVVDRLQNACTSFTYQQGPLTSAVTWTSGHVDVFALAGSHQAVRRTRDPAGWWPPNGWEPHGGVFMQPPVVVSWSSNRLDIFGEGTNHAYFHQWWDGGAWLPSQTDWEGHGGAFEGSPAVASWGPGRLDVFGRGTDGAYYHQYWNGSAWVPSQTDWESHGGNFISPPAVVAWGSNRLDVFGQGQDGAYYHQWSDGVHWFPSLTTWERHGGVFTTPPVVVARASNRLDIFGIARDGAPAHQGWTGNGWSPSSGSWEERGGVVVGQLAVSSWGLNRLDIFAEGTNEAMYHQGWNGSGWTSWIYHGGVLRSGPTASTFSGASAVTVLVASTDGAIWYQDWSQQTSDPTLWQSLGDISGL